MKTQLVPHLLAGLLGVAFTTQLHADMLDPMDFASLGAFDVTNGAYVIDTDALTISETNASSTNLLFTGVIDDQDGQADSFGPGGGVTTVGPLGIPHIAVFTFDDLVMDGTATFTVTGHRALGLLSRGEALINVALSLNGQYPSLVTNAVPGAGGPGGFAGGAVGLDGEGPGGSPYHTAAFGALAAGASFGGKGGPSSGTPLTQPKAPYGNLSEMLQGGSGGGSAFDLINNAVGGGGGGALELGAVDTLTIGVSGALEANGGFSEQPTSAVRGGFGSGGGIRLHATHLILEGTVAATGPGNSISEGGGGRVLLAGDDAHPPYTVGSSPSIPDYTNGVNVDGYGKGWITVVPPTTYVPYGISFELGTLTILQTNLSGGSEYQPGIDLAPADVVVGGAVTVPAGGMVYRSSIVLASPTATLSGSDPLVLRRGGRLSGKGSVTVNVVNDEGGDIITIDDSLAFSGSVSNLAGANITVVSGTLTVPGDGNGATDDGIVNLGTMNLANGVVNGDVHSPSNSIVNVAGTATFNGLFNGGAGFSGTQNLVVFNGGYSPGDSPAAVSFGGGVTFGSRQHTDHGAGRHERGRPIRPAQCRRHRHVRRHAGRGVDERIRARRR